LSFADVLCIQAHTCQVSQFRRESHAFGNEVTVSRWLRIFLAFQFKQKLRKSILWFHE